MPGVALQGWPGIRMRARQAGGRMRPRWSPEEWTPLRGSGPPQVLTGTYHLWLCIFVTRSDAPEAFPTMQESKIELQGVASSLAPDLRWLLGCRQGAARIHGPHGPAGPRGCAPHGGAPGHGQLRPDVAAVGCGDGGVPAGAGGPQPRRLHRRLPGGRRPRCLRRPRRHRCGSPRLHDVLFASLACMWYSMQLGQASGWLGS